jgi:hypothetical protein
VHEYQVEKLYNNIVFTILKANEGIELWIYRPDGTLLSETDPNVIVNKSRLDEVWSIKRSTPWAGTWKVELTGTGEGLISGPRDTFTDILINTINPTSDFVKACQPIDISVEVVNSDCTPFSEHLESFTLQVVTPTGGEILSLSPNWSTGSFTHALWVRRCGGLTTVVWRERLKHTLTKEEYTTLHDTSHLAPSVYGGAAGECGGAAGGFGRQRLQKFPKLFKSGHSER